MRSFRCLSCLVVLGMMTGCQSVVGTWSADKSSGSVSPIAQVTFCRDGTFTASAEYGGNRSHAISGHYKLVDHEIEFETEGKVRKYGIDIDDDEMTMTYKDKSSKMVRMAPRK